MNQRKYFRINDSVALQYRLLPNGDPATLEENYRSQRARLGLSNDFVLAREKKLPKMRHIAQRYPEVAEYLRFLEEELHALHMRLAARDSRLPEAPTHQVNLSASGVGFFSTEPLPEGRYVELSLRLFPLQTGIFALARVARVERQGEEDMWWTALEFTHLPEDDREALVKHIHRLQVSRLRRRQSEEAGAA